MFKVLFIENNKSEKVLIQSHFPETCEVISVPDCKSAIPFISDEEIEIIIVGPSFLSEDYPVLFEISKSFKNTSAVAVLSREFSNKKIINSYESFTGSFFIIPEEFNKIENFFKEISYHISNSTKRKYGASEENILNLFVGSSQVVKKIKASIVKFSKVSAPVLLLGESGTGKDVAASIIHQLSNRHDRKMHVINAGSIIPNLSVSEFFGSNKNAFTGADNRQGCFEYADNGSIFIDEVSELAPFVQAELLRVLQDGSVRKLGSNKIKHFDFRLITATNKSLKVEIESGRFRLDLFHRINTLELVLPPLRERKEDIPDLIMHFSKEFHKKQPEFEFELSDSFIDKLFE
ncbi:MAG: sigma 54-interacting transcriptional regulator, partial [Spirochaetales bacterium]|nr:sigma 54-interacting transcriptional regulator [Spirochaetales bacterium]